MAQEWGLGIVGAGHSPGCGGSGPFLLRDNVATRGQSTRSASTFPKSQGMPGLGSRAEKGRQPPGPSPVTPGPAPPLLCSPHPSHIQAILSPVQPTTQAGPLLFCLSACPSPLPGLLAPLTLPLTLQDESQRKLSKTHICSRCFPAPHSAMTPWCLKALHILPLPLTVFAPPGCSPMGQPALSPQHLPTGLSACSFSAPRLG